VSICYVDEQCATALRHAIDFDLVAVSSALGMFIRVRTKHVGTRNKQARLVIDQESFRVVRERPEAKEPFHRLVDHIANVS
jgi:hypothetical protein